MKPDNSNNARRPLSPANPVKVDKAKTSDKEPPKSAARPAPAKRASVAKATGDRKRRSPWPMRFVLFLLAMGALVWFLPLILSQTSLLQQGVDYGTTKIQGKLVVGSASLGWLAPVQINNVVLYDLEQIPVLTVTRLQSQNSLFNIVANYKKPGVVRIEQPKLFLVLRENGSNLEDILMPLLPHRPHDQGNGGENIANNGADGNAAGHQHNLGGGINMEVGLDVVDGIAEILDTTTNRKWHAEGLTVSLRYPTDLSQPIEAKVQAIIKPDGGTDGGQLSADLLWKRGTTPGIGVLGEGKANVQMKGFPLASLEPALHRFVGQVSTDGILNADAQYEWKPQGDQGDTAHQAQINSLSGERLMLAAPQWLGSDALQLAQLDLAGQVSLANGRCDFKKLTVQSDVVQVQADGSVLLSDLTGKITSDALLAAVQKDDFSVTANLDLARLALLLPGTLRIREGTQITSGKISASLASRQNGNVRQWDGKIETTPFAAMNNGRPVQWDKPIDVTLTAHDSSQGPVVDQLVCESSFLRLKGSGTFDQGEVGVQGDLGQLATELERFFDLSDAQLAGNVQGNVRWQRSGDEQIAGNGTITFNDFALAMRGMRPWQEKQLVINLAGAAQADQNSVKQIDQATAQIQSGNDQLRIDLTKPVATPSAKSMWPIQMEIGGDLATWIPRIQAVCPLNGWNLAGTFRLEKTNAIVSSQGVAVDAAALDINNLRVIGSGLFLEEPIVKAQLQEASIDLSNSQILAKSMTLASSTVAMRATGVSVQKGPNGSSITAAVGFRSDLSRLALWVTDPSKPAMQQIGGLAEGQIRVSLVGDDTEAQMDISVANFVYATPSAGPPGGPPTAFRPAWQEPKLQIAGQGGYQLRSDTFTLKNFGVAGESINVSATGAVTELGQRCVVDIQGQLGYDLQVVALMLRPYIGPTFDIVGREQRPFSMKGPLRDVAINAPPVAIGQLASLPRRMDSAAGPAVSWPPMELTGRFGLGWTGASVQGMTIGAGELQTALMNRVVQIEPLNLTVNEGLMKLAPQIRLDVQPNLLVVDKGVLLENMRLSPEMCNHWLKFVTPAMANVSQVDGRFSIELDDAAVIPLNDPANGEARGVASIQSGQVGPGSLMVEFERLEQVFRSIIELRPPGTNSPRQPINLPEQKIAFQMKNRRVYHEGMQMAIGGIIIYTKGSMGIDHTLDMVAEIPIRDEWITRDKIFSASMKGQTLKIPITGTVNKPHFDHSALTHFTKHAVMNAAGNLLNEPFKRLDKLLQPKQQ